MKMLLCICALVLALAAGISAYEVPDAIVLTNNEASQPQTTWVGDVAFPHGEHAVRDGCNACHHKESGKSLGAFVPCRECHTAGDNEDVTGFYQAWHNDVRHSCIGCHRMERLSGNETPPFECISGCHKPRTDTEADHESTN